MSFCRMTRQLTFDKIYRAVAWPMAVTPLSEHMSTLYVSVQSMQGSLGLCRAFLSLCGALLGLYGSLLSLYRALLSLYRALLSLYRAF